jgi:predicted enzyme related to lactoylglutathione lyase
MTPITTPTLGAIAFDCPDPEALASFYAQLLGGELDVSDPAWCTVRLESAGPMLAFQRVESYERPEWPNGTPQQVHLDLAVTNLEASSRRAVELGAQLLSGPVEEPDCVFIVYADPEGHPFCLCQPR